MAHPRATRQGSIFPFLTDCWRLGKWWWGQSLSHWAGSGSWIWVWWPVCRNWAALSLGFTLVGLIVSSKSKFRTPLCLLPPREGKTRHFSIHAALGVGVMGGNPFFPHLLNVFCYYWVLLCGCLSSCEGGYVWGQLFQALSSGGDSMRFLLSCHLALPPRFSIFCW